MAPTKRRPSPLPAARVHHAEQCALDLLERLGIQRLPVPIEVIAQRLGLEVERAILGDDVSGLLVVQDGRGVIGVSVQHPPTRQRFTIAHEIGHFLLHKDIMPVFIDKQFLQPYFTAFRDSTSSTGENKREREANSFAAALLMPPRLVLDAIATLQTDITDDDAVEDLAKRFQVSRQAMAFRLANLALATEEAAHVPRSRKGERSATKQHEARAT